MSAFIGLDFEASGTNHSRHAPIQIGLATPEGAVYSHLVGGWNWTGEGLINANEYDWDERAAEIHNITRLALEFAGSAPMIDTFSAGFIHEHYPDVRPAKLHAVGWNVASFDFPFLRKHFPLTSRAISYRSVDLNAIVFAMTQAKLTDGNGDQWGYQRLKGYAKDRAAHRVWEETGQDQAWHEAGYDALTALYAFEAPQDEMKGPTL